MKSIYRNNEKIGMRDHPDLLLESEISVLTSREKRDKIIYGESYIFFR